MRQEFYENEIFAGMYQILREIGRGGAGIVYLAYHLRLQKYVVVKRIRTRYGSEATMRAEADILKDLHHPCLPQVYDYFCDAGEVFTVMDYIEGMDLSKLIEQGVRLPEKQLLSWARQLAEVLDYLHTRRHPIIHSDIKPSNIILRPDGSMCLIDFNISLVANVDREIKGFSEQYASPEQIYLADAVRSGGTVSGTVDVGTDLYSLGATFYTLVSGLVPNGRCVSTPLQEMPGLGISQPFAQIIDRCMAWDRRQRYADAAALLDALQDLKRSDIRYRRYVRRRVASLLVSGVLAAMGAFCLVRGFQERDAESYRADFARFAEACEQADSETVSELGLSMLSDGRYEALLRRQPQDEAAILHALGDVEFDADRFSGAAEYYSRALDAARLGGGDLGAYYRDAVIALVRSDRSQEAEALLEEAERSGVDSGSLKLAKMSIAMQQLDYDLGLELAEQVLRSGDAQVCYRACLEAAEALRARGQPAEAAQWLERAGTYVSGARVDRELAELNLQLANTQRQKSAARDKYLKNALLCYERLFAEIVPTATDYINRSIAQSSSGDFRTAVKTLLECRERWGSSFQTDMNLAFAYHALADEAGAARYCTIALSEYGELSSAQQEAYASDYEMLRQLSEALN